MPLWRRPRLACIALAAMALSSLSNFAAAGAHSPLPPVRHVFILILENESFETTFGPRSPAHYLKSLGRRGALVRNYFATSHFSLGNYLSLISGQAPDPATDLDCPVFEDFVASGVRSDGQAVGKGCVYPASIPTLTHQLEAKGLTWKGYMEDMGNVPRRESATCGHPPIGAHDNTEEAERRDQYAARHDPFVYFHSIIDTPSCAQHVVNFAALAEDLKSVATTPNYVFITPNVCHDGHDGGANGTCVDGEPGGLASADKFLETVVPQILASPAFRRDGLLVITFDEAGLEYDFDAATHTLKVKGGDVAACCNEQSGPNIPAYRADGSGAGAGLDGSGINGPGIAGPGGGRVGAVMLSRFIKPGTVSNVPYNHYATLKSVEDLFHLAHLGYAGQPGLRGFGPDIYTGAAAPGATPPVSKP